MARTTPTRSVLLALCAPLFVSALARAQSFNVDLFANASSAPPSASFGAAAGQPGHWNGIECAYCEQQTFPLADLGGLATPVVLRMVLGGVGTVCSTSSGTPDEDALRQSFQEGSNDQFTAITANVLGLSAGVYDVFVYAGATCTEAPDAISSFCYMLPAGPGIAFGIQVQTVPGDARFRVEIPSGVRLGLHLISTQGRFAAQGLQIVRIDDAVTPICFGTSTEAACPCGPGAFGRGCPSSFEPLGAKLEGSGTTSVVADTLQLAASSVSNSVVTFFQGTTLPNQGAGAVFGDGLRCAGGATTRIVSIQASNGAASYPSPGDPSISLRGAVPATGGTRYYQVRYRNVASFCTPDTFNTTNGVRVAWVP